MSRYNTPLFQSNGQDISLLKESQIIQTDPTRTIYPLYQGNTLAPLHKHLFTLFVTLLFTTRLIVSGLFTSWRTWPTAGTPVEARIAISIIASYGAAIPVAENRSLRFWRVGKSREGVVTGGSRSRTGTVEGCR
jgi:hypothetical protein